MEQYTHLTQSEESLNPEKVHDVDCPFSTSGRQMLPDETFGNKQLPKVEARYIGR